MFDRLFPPGSKRLLVAKNTTAQLIGKIIGAGTTFVVSLVIARQFGADGYGDFVKVTTYIAFFFLVADFGINAIFLQKPKDFWGALVGLRIIGSVGLIFLSLAILSFIPQGVSQGYTPLVRLGIILFAPAIFFQALLTTANAVFQRELRYGFATIAIAIGSLTTLGVLWLLTKAGFLTAVVSGTLALLAGSTLTAIVAFGFVRTFQPLTISFSPKFLRQLFIPAIPLGLTLLFNLVYGHGDSIILTLTRRTAEVGIYGLAYRVFEVGLVLPTFFMNAVYPMLLKAKGDNQRLTGNSEQFRKILRTSFSFLMVSSLILVVLMWFFAPWMIFIKEDFAASVPALRVLSLGLPFFFLSVIPMWALIALGKQKALAILYGVSMILNILLCIWFIPLYGYMAAAWITVVSEGLILALSGIVLLNIVGKIL